MLPHVRVALEIVFPFPVDICNTEKSFSVAKSRVWQQNQFVFFTFIVWIQPIRMLTAAQSLLGFAAWTGFHILVIGGYRISQVLLYGRKPNTFPSGQTHGGPDVYQNILRAHANCVENLPLLAIVIILNKIYNGPNLDVLAQSYLICRIGQSLSHWVSTSNKAVSVRFAFFGAQLALLIAMGFLTLPALAGK